MHECHYIVKAIYQTMGKIEKTKDGNQLELFVTAKKPYDKETIPRGVRKLALIFDELSNQVGDSFSSADLLRAAQELIKISKGDYVNKVSIEYRGGPHYFARDVCSIFSKYQSQALIFENALTNHCDTPEFSHEELDRFRVINLSLNDKKWEF